MIGFAHGGTIVMLFQETNGNPCLFVKNNGEEKITRENAFNEYLRLKGELLR